MSEEKNCGKDMACGKEYSTAHVLLDNVPYAIMVSIGAIVLWKVFGLIYGLGFVVWGLAGALWFMVFICPYCHFYGTKICPCGYGIVSSRFMPKKDGSQFAKKFKRHIPVIFPLWFLPVIAGGYAYFNGGLSGSMVTLLVVFALDAFVILPYVSRKYGCSECSQKDDCPWMGKKKG
ncbi:hypothetical protein A2276_08730 [candidate division WOR-1 bacterium RIFOXYA12_FULL_43_27]|nr:MAG: hypothetical protein A2276_08730 [candidate division WOR-1 bacterium RIFOXYA12_FULL_43_27]